MTKERKAAIEQWLIVKAYIAINGVFKKPLAEYGWRFNCWFCQYVRTNKTKGNGCTKCPLWKWAKAYGRDIDEHVCGCSCSCSSYRFTTLYEKVLNERLPLRARIKACDLIIAALKGEHIWEP